MVSASGALICAQAKNNLLEYYELTSRVISRFSTWIFLLLIQFKIIVFFDESKYTYRA